MDPRFSESSGIAAFSDEEQKIRRQKIEELEKILKAQCTLFSQPPTKTTSGTESQPSSPPSQQPTRKIREVAQSIASMNSTPPSRIMFKHRNNTDTLQLIQETADENIGAHSDVKCFKLKRPFDNQMNVPERQSMLRKQTLASIAE